MSDSSGMLGSMESGHAFTLYEASSSSLPDGRSMRITLWLDWGEKAADSPSSNSNSDWSKACFRWDEEGKKEKSDERKFNINAITDVMIGKQSPVLQSPLAAAALDDACMTIKGKKRELHLSCESEEALEKWVDGLNYILTLKGTMVIEEAEEADIVVEQEQKQDAAEEKSDEPSGAEALSMIVSGVELMIHMDGDVSKRVTVWYEPTASESGNKKLGHLYYTDDGTRNKLNDQRISCQRLSDVLLGKQTSILTAISSLSDDECFTMKSASDEWNLSGEEKQVNDFIIGINHLLAQGNKQVVLEEEGEEAATSSSSKESNPFDAAAAARPNRRRVSYVASSAPSVSEQPAQTGHRYSIAYIGQQGVVPEESETDLDVPSPQSEEDEQRGAAVAPIDSSPSHAASTAPLALEPSNVISALEAGSKMKIHTADSVSEKYVWLNAKEGSLGALYVADKKPEGTDAAIDGNDKLNLSDLTDVYVGVVQFDQPTTAAADRSVSLVSGKQKKFHLELASVESLNAFLFALNQQLTSSGSAVVYAEEEAKKSAEADQLPATRATRFSVCQRDPANDASASSTPAGMAPAAFGLSQDASTMESMLAAGRTFKQHVNTTGTAETKELLVWYQNGALLWNQDGKKEEVKGQVLPLTDITDIYYGKQTPNFLMSHLAFNIPNQQCFTLQSSKLDVQLDLEAESADVVTSWLQAIHQLLTNSGRKVVHDEKQQTPSSAMGASNGKPLRRFSVLQAENSSVMQKAIKHQKPKQKSSASAAGAKLTAPMSQSSDSILNNGQQFTLHSTSAPHQRQITLFFSRDVNSADGSKGVLFWTEDGSRTMDRKASLGIKNITDVYLGPQRGAFLGATSSVVNGDCCVSLVSQQGASLDLEASSPESLNAFLMSLSSLLSGSGREVLLEKEPEKDTKPKKDDSRSQAPARSRRYSVQTGSSPSGTAPAATSSPTTMSMSPDAYIRIMTSGRDVRLYTYDESDRSVKASSGFVWYDSSAGDIGTIYASAGKGSDKAAKKQSAPLSHLRDVYVSANHPIFVQADVERASLKNCLSLVGKGFELHMDMMSSEVLNAWLAGLQAILTKSGNKIVKQELKRQKAASSASASGSNASAAPAKGVSAGEAAVKHIQSGSSFTRFFNGHARRCFVWYNPAKNAPMGTIFHSEDQSAAVTKEEQEERSMPIASLIDIFQGKKTAGMRSSVASMAPREQCISFKSETQTLDLWAGSDTEVKQWLAALRHILSTGGVQVVDSKATPASGNRRISIMQTSLGGNKQQVGSHALVAHITNGSDMIMHQSAEQRSKVTIWYAPSVENDRVPSNSLFWTPVGEPKTPNPSRRFQLRYTTDVFMGRRAKSFPAVPESVASRDRCFSIQSKNIVWHLEAASERERNTWLAALKVVVGEALGKRVEEAGGAPVAASPDRRPAPMNLGAVPAPLKSLIAPALSLSAAELFRLLLEGRAFYMHEASKNDATNVTKSKVWLFYREGEVNAKGKKSRGTLHWMPIPDDSDSLNGEPVISEDKTFDLGLVTDLFTGKLTPVMKSETASAASEDCCLSLVGSNGVLNLEASSSESCTIFLAALSNALSGGGRGLVLETDRKKTAGVANIAGTDNAALRNDRVLTLASSNAIMRLTKGIDFTLWQKDAATKKLQSKPISIFYELPVSSTADDSDWGHLYWCDRGENKLVSSSTLNVTDVREVFCGKISPNFQRDDATNAVEDRCVSLVTVRSILDLEAPSSDAFSTFVEFLSDLLTVHGASLVSDAFKQDLSVAEEKKKLEQEQRRFKVSPGSELQDLAHAAFESSASSAGIAADPDRAKAALNAIVTARNFDIEDESLRGDVQAAIGKLTKGVVMSGYAEDRNGSVEKREILVFLNDATRSFHWCNPNERDESPYRCLAVGDISELLLGKATSIWQNDVAKGVKNESCLTLLSNADDNEVRQVDVEMDASIRREFVFGVEACLAREGLTLKRVDLESNTVGRNRRRYSVLRAAASNQSLCEKYDMTEMMNGNGADLLRQLAAGLLTSSPVLSEALRMVQDGCPAVRYFNRDGCILREEVVLFHVPAPGSAGSLYWCPRDAERVQNESNRFDLTWLRDVCLGHRVQAWQAPIAASVNRQRCFTLLAKSGRAVSGVSELNIELESPQQVGVWMYVIRALVSKTGLGTRVEDPLARGAASPTLTRAPSPATHKRMSFIRPEKSGAAVSSRGRPSPLAARAMNTLLTGNTEEAVRVMETGSEFRLYELHDGEPSISQVWLFYSADDTMLGSVYWNVLGSSKQRAQERCVPLHEITDIYTGRQTDVLRHPAFSGAVDSLCVSIVGRNSSIHTQASNKQQLNTWLFGMNKIINSRGGTKIVLEENPTPIPHSPSTVSPVHCPLMRAGTVANVHLERDGLLSVRKQFVFYASNAPHGPRICWTDVDVKTEKETERLAIQDLTDVYLGKQTSVSRKMTADRRRCLSLVTSSVSLNMELESADMVKGWVRELAAVIKHYGSKVLEQKPASNRSDPNQSRADQFRRALSALPADANVRIASEGRMFYVWSKDPVSEKVTRKAQHVFYVSEEEQSAGGLGTLFWSEVGQAERDAMRSMPIINVTDIYAGKQTATLRNAAASDAPAKCCASFVGVGGQQLNVEAQSANIMSSFLAAINTVLTGAGATVIVNDPKQQQEKASNGTQQQQQSSGGRRFSIMPFRKPASLPSTANETMKAVRDGKAAMNEAETKATLDMMQKGRRFIRIYEKSKKEVAKEEVSVFYSEKDHTIYWCKPGQRTTDAKQSMPLSPLRRCLLGKQSPLLKWDIASAFKADRCFALVDRHESTLALVGESGEVVSAWVAGLQHLLSNKSRRRIEVDGPAKYEKPAALPVTAEETVRQVAARRQTIMQLDNRDTIDMMRGGSRFYRYTLNKKKKAVREQVTVFFDERTFWWCAASGGKKKVASQSLPLKNLTDVHLGLGKASKALTAPGSESAVASRCVALVSKDGTALELEAESNEQLSAFIFGLQGIISSDGREVVVEDKKAEAASAAASSSSSQQSGSRRFSILSPGESVADVSKSRHAEFKRAVLSLPADETIQTMESGHLANVFTFDSNGSLMKSVQHVFFYPAKPLGYMVWTDSIKDRTRKPDKSIDLSSLEDAYVGKQYAPVFSQSIAASCDDTRCLSLVANGGKQQVSFEFESAAVLTLYISGISNVLNGGGMVVELQSEESGASSSSSSSAKSGGRRYSVSPYTLPSEAPSDPMLMAQQVAARRPTLLALNSGSTILMMQEGRAFTRYYRAADGAIKSEEVTLFYQGGAFCWCPAGEHKAVPGQTLQLDIIQHIYLQKQTAVLQSAAAASAPPSQCLSFFSVDGTSLDICASNLELLSAWLFGLNSLLSNSGRDVELDDSQAANADASTTGSRRFSVVTSKAEQKRQENESVAHDPSVHVMQDGARFWLYEVDENDSTVINRRDVQVWLQLNASSVGVLNWCKSALSPRVAKPSQSLALNSVTDVYSAGCGKLFTSRTGILADCVASRCVTFVTSSGVELNLEAQQDGMVETFLEGLRVLLTQGGRKIEEEQIQVDQKQEEQPVANGEDHQAEVRGARRMSVMPAPASETVSSSSSSSAPSRPVLGLAPSDSLTLLKRGQMFFRYVVDMDGKNVKRVVVWLYYRPSESGGESGGAIHWIEKEPPVDTEELVPDAEHTLTVSAITEICTGHSVGAFLLSETRAIMLSESSKCFALVGAKGQQTLSLEALSSESMSAWLIQLHNLFQSARRTIVDGVEEKSEGVTAMQPDEELASNELVDVLAGGAELSEEERRAIIEASNGNRRRFSVKPVEEEEVKLEEVEAPAASAPTGESSAEAPVAAASNASEEVAAAAAPSEEAAADASPNEAEAHVESNAQAEEEKEQQQVEDAKAE